ncbi:MAG TPA: hypothetical protein VK171_16885 [Fimbriimonas sp.]|nr:hypothetical protein [Fimbriimonas sp.]
MKHHLNPILDYDILPDSTRRFYQRRIGRLYQLCIWAAWHKAKREGVAINLEAIFGETGFAGYVFRDRRTDEMIVAFESPTEHYEYYGEFYAGGRSSRNLASGDRLLNGVAMTGMAVEKVLKARLGDEELRTLLRYLPFFGKFKGDALPFDARSPAPARQAQKASLAAGTSLRDSAKPRFNFLIDDEGTLLAEIQRAMNHRVVKAAIRALEQRAPMARE